MTLRRGVYALLTMLVVAVGITALVVRPGVPEQRPEADYVIVAGVAGLRWEDVDPQTTPTLWRMAGTGGIGSLAVRSAQPTTCPVDGWLTLGAGNYAAWNDAPVPAECPEVNVVVEQPDGIGAYLPEQQTAVWHNQQTRNWGAVPGSLAESVRCTVAVGTGAAVAAARPFGRVDRYAPELPENPRELLASCVLSLVDLGTVSGDDPQARRMAAAAADAQLARVLAARPADSLVVVAGLADTDQTNRLHVVVADGPGWEGRWLTSASTGRPGYVQLVDLAPTALTVLDRQIPERRFIGHALAPAQERPADLTEAIGGLADADGEARAQRAVAEWFFALLVAVQVALAVGILPLLRRARRPAGPVAPVPVSPRVVAVMEVLLIAAAVAIPAALLADVLPWWQGSHAGWYFAATTMVLILAATAAVRFLPGYQQTLTPLGAVAALTTLVVGADVITGARLQLNGVTGYSALEGGRYSGVGTVGLGVLIAAALLSSGWLAQRMPRPWRPAVVVLIGMATVVIVGSPYLGADAVGAIALTAGVSIAAALCTGGWLTVTRAAWTTLAGLAVTVGFAVVDLRRPPQDRGSLGRFINALADGTGGSTLHRSTSANLTALTGSPLTILAVVGVALVAFALLQPWGGLRRLFGIYPTMRAAMAGIAVAAVSGGLLAGAGLDVAGAAAAVTVPMASLAALRVLGHAADRTQPDGPRPVDFGPPRPDSAGPPPPEHSDPAGGGGSPRTRPVAPAARASGDALGGGDGASGDRACGDEPVGSGPAPGRQGRAAAP